MLDNRFDAETIAAAIFDGTVKTEHRIGLQESLRNLFRKKADRKRATSSTRAKSLAEALTDLEKQGMGFEDSGILKSNLRRFMNEQIERRYARVSQNGRMTIILRVSSNEDWDDSYFLGVRLTNPPTDFSTDKDALSMMRKEFKHWIQTALQSHGTMFIKNDRPGFVEPMRYARISPSSFGFKGFGPFGG